MKEMMKAVVEAKKRVAEVRAELTAIRSRQPDLERKMEDTVSELNILLNRQRTRESSIRIDILNKEMDRLTFDHKYLRKEDCDKTYELNLVTEAAIEVESALWNEIYRREVQKALPAIKRVVAAYRQSCYCGRDFYGIVPAVNAFGLPAALVEEANEHLGQFVTEFEREYLS